MYAIPDESSYRWRIAMRVIQASSLILCRGMMAASLYRLPPADAARLATGSGRANFSRRMSGLY